MLQFIDKTYSSFTVSALFKNISCYSLSGAAEAKETISSDLKTSHVTVYPCHAKFDLREGNI